MGEEQEKTSKYNEAVNQIIRLNNIWVDCRRFREGGLLEKYKWVLDSAEVELTIDIKKEHRKKLKELNSKIEKALGRKLYLFLIRKEKLLRLIQEKAGKGGTYIDPEEDNWD
jgi:hypothetical protein